MSYCSPARAAALLGYQHRTPQPFTCRQSCLTTCLIVTCSSLQTSKRVRSGCGGAPCSPVAAPSYHPYHVLCKRVTRCVCLPEAVLSAPPRYRCPGWHAMPAVGPRPFLSTPSPVRRSRQLRALGLPPSRVRETANSRPRPGGWGDGRRKPCAVQAPGGCGDLDPASTLRRGARHVFAHVLEDAFDGFFSDLLSHVAGGRSVN